LGGFSKETGNEDETKQTVYYDHPIIYYRIDKVSFIGLARNVSILFFYERKKIT